MKCDELKDRWFWAYPTESVDCDGITGSAHEVYGKSEVDAAIAELKAQVNAHNNRANLWHYNAQNEHNAAVAVRMENAVLKATKRMLKRDLWLMTAEWAEGMGLASCNIAIKLSFKERFFYHDEANREKDIKKYRHRQVVFYKYADYCRAKAEEYK